MTKRISIGAAKRLAADTGCTQVIVMAWDGQVTHVVTYGKTAVDCDHAAQGADLMKKTMGWPYDPTCLPSRVKTLQKENEALRAALQEHHNWHLQQTEEDPEIFMSPAEAYAESQMCDHTIEALRIPAPAMEA